MNFVQYLSAALASQQLFVSFRSASWLAILWRAAQQCEAPSLADACVRLLLGPNILIIMMRSHSLVSIGHTHTHCRAWFYHVLPLYLL